jgi:2-keto-4-pentenoate hydratase/2-oxohepta-3-ene-1,7-dioic acid hydratase in catechol pathway
MKLISFRAFGKDTYGLVNDAGVVDLGKRLGSKYPDLKSLIAAGAVQEAREFTSSAADHAFDDVELLPVIPNPGKIICVGLNYKTHRDETGRAPTDNPALFIRFPDSQVAHGQSIVRPKISEKLDYEGELAVVVGKSAKYVSEDDAFSIIAGYSCYNDGSIRDWQGHTLQWTPGKNFAKTGGFGPWMVTQDEIADVNELVLTTRLNGSVMQQTGINLMIFPIPTIIAYLTKFTELHPGDVIVTGTPGGVGFKRTPPVFMKPGDKVEIEISNIGTLQNSIAAE